jgi:hypothetical protein
MSGAIAPLPNTPSWLSAELKISTGTTLHLIYLTLLDNSHMSIATFYSSRKGKGKVVPVRNGEWTYSSAHSVTSTLYGGKWSASHHKSQPLDPILSQPNSVGPTIPMSLMSILRLSSHLRLGLPSDFFNCLGRAKETVQVRGALEHFVTSYIFTVPTPKLENHSLPTVRDFLFNIFAATNCI